MGRRAGRAAALVLGLLLLGGCGRTLASVDLERGITERYTRDSGTKPSSVTCPDVDAQKGAEATCEMTLGGQEYDVTVRVARVDDDEIGYTTDARPR